MIYQTYEIVYGLLLLSITVVLIEYIWYSQFAKKEEDFEMNLSSRDLAKSYLLIITISTLVFNIYQTE